MSGATYRIDVEHRPDPHSHAGIDWIARITRLSDETQLHALWGRSSDDAAAKARAWLFGQSEQQSSRSLLVNDEGQEVTP